jgi:hypothetical protein
MVRRSGEMSNGGSILRKLPTRKALVIDACSQISADHDAPTPDRSAATVQRS